MMATNHGRHQQHQPGETSERPHATISSAPSGRRSTASVPSAPTNIRTNGPLRSMPPASAVHRIAGSSPADCRLGRSPAGEIDACQRTHGRDRGEQQHGVGLGESRLDAEQNRARHHHCGNNGGAARNEGKRCPVGQENRECRARQARAVGRARSSCAPAARPAPHPLSPLPLAASRCRPASCSAPRSESGYRRIRASPASAWWLARSALHRDRPAVSGKTPARRQSARRPQAARRRGDATRLQSRARRQARAPEQYRAVPRQWS